VGLSLSFIFLLQTSVNVVFFFQSTIWKSEFQEKALKLDFEILHGNGYRLLDPNGLHDPSALLEGKDVMEK
jgi:hypothetical protein